MGTGCGDRDEEQARGPAVRMKCGDWVWGLGTCYGIWVWGLGGRTRRRDQAP